jgi:hypothetical protein
MMVCGAVIAPVRPAFKRSIEMLTAEQVDRYVVSYAEQVAWHERRFAAAW